MGEKLEISSPWLDDWRLVPNTGASSKKLEAGLLWCLVNLAVNLAWMCGFISEPRKNMGDLANHHDALLISLSACHSAMALALVKRH